MFSNLIVILGQRKCCYFSHPHPHHFFAICLADFVSILLGWDVGLVLCMMKVVGDLQGILVDCMTQKHQLLGIEEVLQNRHTTHICI